MTNKILNIALAVVLVLLGIATQISSLYFFYLGENLLGTLIFFVGVGIFVLASSFTDWKKFVVKFSLSIAVLLLSFAIIFYGINSYSDEIASSIQPSIDTLLATSIDTLVDQQFSEIESSQIDLLLGTEKKIERVYSHNLTSEQAQLFADAFEIEFETEEEEKDFAKFIINTIYSQTSETNLSNISIPLSLLASQVDGEEAKEMVSSFDTQTLDVLCETDPELLSEAFTTMQTLCKENPSQLSTLGMGDMVEQCIEDPNSLDTLNTEMISSLCVDNQKANLNIILFEKEEIVTVDPSNIEQEDVELVWENLDFPDNISYESKEKITQISLSMLGEQTQGNDIIKDVAIPVASISSVIPQDVKILVGYDIFSPDTEVRVKMISSARSDCQEGRIEMAEICSAIMMTQYENLIANVENMTPEEEGIEMPLNMSAVFANMNTIEKVETTIDENTSSWKIMVPLILIFFAIAFFFTYLHFKENGVQEPYFDAAFFIARYNFMKFIPYAVLTGVIVYLLTGSYLIDFASQNVPEEAKEIVGTISELPIIQVFNEMLKNIFSITFYYLIFSFLTYMLLYLRKRLHAYKQTGQAI